MVPENHPYRSAGFAIGEIVRQVERKVRTASYPLTVAIMGCVVNGPGEMGDVDYGFVGSGNGKVNLYKGQQLVKRTIPYENAVEEMEQLIRDSGDWAEA